MNKEQKRKLRNISLLALAGLIGGTFAFTAFNQQAINDRLRDNEVEVGGRVHDYYNRDTENKDVFVENYGQTPIMARIRLSEFMEIQGRGQDNFTPVVDGTSRENTQSWSTYIPSAGNIGTRTGAGAAFNQYSNLTFGWTRSGQTAPWYLPTFNHNDEDLRTAAAGDARDYLEEGATHPGDGTDAYWSEGENHDNSVGTWPGSMVTRETAQNLPQDREPMTLQSWSDLTNDADKVGNFWVIDHETGWAYWANQLNGGQATSYLLDAAEMTPDADAINGTYYYGIHVDSELINLERQFQDEPDTGEVSELLEEVRTNGTGNPAPTTVAPASALNFSRMSDTAGANTRFTIETPAGPQQFRYLENMGSGNHLIIRNEVIRLVPAAEKVTRVDTWFNSELPADLKALVAPVASDFATGSLEDTMNLFQFGSERWTIANLDNFPELSADLTKVVPISEGGVRRAFSLSVADIQRLSVSPDIGFANLEDRIGPENSWWWLRSTSHNRRLWQIFTTGGLNNPPAQPTNDSGGLRPALIIHQ